MARKINWSEPLSDEDRAWVEQRPDQLDDGISLRERLEAHDVEFNKIGKDVSKSRQERLQELRAMVNDGVNEIARLEKEEADEANQNKALAGSVGDQAAGLIVRDNTPVNGEVPQGAPTEIEDYSDETYWTKAKLQEEIDSRNNELKAQGLDTMPRTGTRAELVERLRKDDEELAKG